MTPEAQALLGAGMIFYIVLAAIAETCDRVLGWVWVALLLMSAEGE